MKMIFMQCVKFFPLPKMGCFAPSLVQATTTLNASCSGAAGKHSSTNSQTVYKVEAQQQAVDENPPKPVERANEGADI